MISCFKVSKRLENCENILLSEMLSRVQRSSIKIEFIMRFRNKAVSTIKDVCKKQFLSLSSQNIENIVVARVKRKGTQKISPPSPAVPILLKFQSINKCFKIIENANYGKTLLSQLSGILSVQVKR